MTAPAAMFSVALVDPGAETAALQWLVTCDRCGQEIEAVAPGPAPPVTINGPTKESWEEFRLRMQQMERSRSISRAIVVDSDVEDHRLDRVLREHARACPCKDGA